MWQRNNLLSYAGRFYARNIHNPNTYVDKMHSEIRVVSVDTGAHVVTYAAGGISSSLTPYLGATLA